MTASPAPRLALLVEDLPASSDWLQQVLQDTFKGIQVHPAASLAAARGWLSEHQPDLALVDLGLPDGSGIDLIRELASRHPGCHVIVSSIYSDDLHLFPALRAGAQGYLLKDQPKEKLIAALRGIAGGEPPLSPVIAQRLLRVFGTDQTSATSGGEAPLSPRERETLILIAKGYKLPDVAEQLGITRNTAAGFIKAVYRKLNVNSRAEATLEAARLGLVSTQL
ncbi:MAG TPA: response regulator transcription factor [Nevskiaceae bacterium]|nr:response regulator transcription factor [Nevskiaceae bacterium]